MRTARALCLLTAWLLIPAYSPGAEPGEEPLAEGWRKVLAIPDPRLGAGDRYTIWVEGGWLQARRETASGETDWHIVLARAIDPKPPVIAAPEKSQRFDLTYRDGRYFIREYGAIIRSLREPKGSGGPWPGVPFEAKDSTYRVGTTLPPMVQMWVHRGWYAAACCPAQGRLDCLLRLFPATTRTGKEDDKAFRYVATKYTGTPLSRVGSGEIFVMDDGELLVGIRALEGLLSAGPGEGDPAPPFEVRSLDRKTLKLVDYRGKYVLLDFWATWCIPCLEEMPRLKELHEEFGKDGRLVVIGLSLDEDAEAARKLVAEKKLPWTQAVLGEASESPVAKDYSIQVLPTTILIGPDGRIIAQGMRGSQIRTTVENAIGRR